MNEANVSVEDFRLYTREVLTTLEPADQETMHAMMLSRWFYEAWDLDVAGYSSGELGQRTRNNAFALVEAAYQADVAVSAPVMLYAATVGSYNPDLLLEIPHNGSELMVFAGTVLDGDKLDVSVVRDPEVMQYTRDVVRMMNEALDVRGMTTSHETVMSLETPLKWGDAAQLIMSPLNESAKVRGDAVVKWLTNWALETYTHRVRGEAFDMLPPAPMFR